MMSDSLLQEAFNDCIDRLAGGQSIEDCLAVYPQLADELRPLLIAGTAPSRLRADASELSAMRRRLDAEMEALIEDTNFSSASRLPNGVLTLVASLLIVLIGFGIVFTSNNNVGTQATETPTITPTDIIETVTQTVIPTDESITITPSPTETTVSATEEACTLRSDWLEYTIQSGDSLSLIAVNSGTTIEALRDGNCLDDDAFIVIGTTLLVPQLWEQSNTSNDSGGNVGTGDSGSSDNTSSSDDNDDDDDDSDDSDDDED